MTKKSQILRVHGVSIALDEPDDVLVQRVAKKLKIGKEHIDDVVLVKRSLDARKRPKFICTVDVTVDQVPKALPGDVGPAPEPIVPQKFTPKRQERVVVIGAGPAGLFCAHRLAEAGLKPVLVDRGEPVEIRGRHVSGLMHRGELLEDSNICFGEGGAGTWSDGKLYTRVKDVRVRHVLETIVQLGGPEEILTAGKPHLGTDRLVALCKAFRAMLIDEGCEVHFGAFVDGFELSHGEDGVAVRSVILRDGTKIDGDRFVLAVGHSARELYLRLDESGIAMEQKPFAVGYRVEHRQALINEIQYGQWAEMPEVPTADYRLAANFGEGDAHRGVYSFCMCPGGQVVPSATQPDGVCVNGMSHASRKGHWANSALVVSVKPEDFHAFPEDEMGPYTGRLAGVGFQKAAEKRAYTLGGGGFIAPSQRLVDFRDGVETTELRKTTYKPGIAPGDLTTCYPAFVIEHLRAGLAEFEKRMPGFNTNDAILIGVETRTSAPIQITRDDETLRSISWHNLYPSGEGAGYGGGIVSAAIDGLRVAERILEELSELVA